MTSLWELYAGSLSKPTLSNIGKTAASGSSGGYVMAQRRRKRILESKVKRGTLKLSQLGTSDSLLLNSRTSRRHDDDDHKFGSFSGLGKVGGFVSNLGEDIYGAARGFIPGSIELGKAVWHDVTDLSGYGKKPDEDSQIMEKIVNPTIESYKYMYGGKGAGDKGFLERLYEHPLGPILDVATVFSGGAAGAARAGGVAARSAQPGSLLSRVGQQATRLTAREGRAPLMKDGQEVAQREYTARPLSKAGQIVIDKLADSAIGGSLKRRQITSAEKRRARGDVGIIEGAVLSAQRLTQEKLHSAFGLTDDEERALFLSQTGFNDDAAIDAREAHVREQLQDPEFLQLADNLKVPREYIERWADVGPVVRDLVKNPTPKMQRANKRWVKEVNKNLESMPLDQAMHEAHIRKAPQLLGVLDETPIGYHGRATANVAPERAGQALPPGDYPFHFGERRQAAEDLLKFSRKDQPHFESKVHEIFPATKEGLKTPTSRGELQRIFGDDELGENILNRYFHHDPKTDTYQARDGFANDIGYKTGEWREYIENPEMWEERKRTLQRRHEGRPEGAYDEQLARETRIVEGLRKMMDEGYEGVPYINTKEDPDRTSWSMFSRESVSEHPPLQPTKDYPIETTYVPAKVAAGFEKRKGFLGRREAFVKSKYEPITPERTAKTLYAERTPSYLHGSTGETLISGLARYDRGIYLEHDLERTKALVEATYGKAQLAAVAAKDSDGEILTAMNDEDMFKQHGLDRKDWAVIHPEFPVSFYRHEIDLAEELKKVAAKLEEEGSEFGGADLDGVLSQMAEADAKAFISQHWGAAKKPGWIVPRAYHEERMAIAAASDPFKWAPARAVAKYLHVWRTWTLGMMLRWMVNTAVGSFVLAVTRGLTPRNFAQASKLQRTYIDTETGETVVRPTLPARVTRMKEDLDFENRELQHVLPEGVNLRAQAKQEWNEFSAPAFQRFLGLRFPLAKQMVEQVQRVEDFFRRAHFVKNMRREQRLERDATGGRDVEITDPTPTIRPEAEEGSSQIRDWRELPRDMRDALRGVFEFEGMGIDDARQQRMWAYITDSGNDEMAIRLYDWWQGRGEFAEDAPYRIRSEHGGWIELEPHIARQAIDNPNEYDLEPDELEDLRELVWARERQAKRQNGEPGQERPSTPENPLGGFFDRVRNHKGSIERLLEDTLEDPHLTQRAIDETNKFAYAYSSLSPFERRYVRQFIPFWGWYKFVSLLAWRLPVEMPGRVNMIRILGQVGNEVYEDYYGDLPDWLKGAVIWGKTASGKIKYAPTGGINPFAEFFNPAKGLAGGPRWGQFSPPIQALLAAYGTDPLTGDRVRISPESGVVPNFLGQLVDEEGRQRQPREVEGTWRFLAALARSFPQYRAAERFSPSFGAGGAVFPEHVPYIHERPMSPNDPEGPQGTSAILSTWTGIPYPPRLFDLDKYQSITEKSARYNNSRVKSEKKRIKKKFADAKR